jgi:hypothetical protein
LSTKFITDIKRIYILCFVIFEPYYSRYFIRGDQNSKREAGWAGNVAGMGEKRYVYVVVGNWGDPEVDGRIILRYMFRKLEGVVGLDGVGSG